MASQCFIERLPAELMEMVAHNCEIAGLLSLMRTSRSFHVAARQIRVTRRVMATKTVWHRGESWLPRCLASDRSTANWAKWAKADYDVSAASVNNLHYDIPLPEVDDQFHLYFPQMLATGREYLPLR